MDVCRKTEDRLIDLIAGDLSGIESAEVEAHLGNCASCQAAYEFLTSDLPALMPAPAEAPAYLTDDALAYVSAFEGGLVRNGVKISPTIQRVKKLVFAAAAASLMFAVVSLSANHVRTAESAAHVKTYHRNLLQIYAGLQKYNDVRDQGSLAFVDAKPFMIGLVDNGFVEASVKHYPESVYPVSYVFNNNLSLDRAARAVRLGWRASPKKHGGSLSGVGRSYSIPLAWTIPGDATFGHDMALVLFASGNVEFVDAETVRGFTKETAAE